MAEGDCRKFSIPLAFAPFRFGTTLQSWHIFYFCFHACKWNVNIAVQYKRFSYSVLVWCHVRFLWAVCESVLHNWNNSITFSRISVFRKWHNKISYRKYNLKGTICILIKIGYYHEFIDSIKFSLGAIQIDHHELIMISLYKFEMLSCNSFLV